MRVGKLRMNAVAALSCVLGAGIALGFSGVLAAPANTPQARADAAFKAAGKARTGDHKSGRQGVHAAMGPG